MRKSSDKEYCPADDVLAYIHDQMLTRELHTKLLVILKGNLLDEFQHALCFLRKDFLYNKGRLNQLLLLDSKNSGPCVYPRFHRELQLQFNDEDRVNAKEDLLNKVYYAADIYTLSMRPVAGPEKRRIENRMKWVLTGEEKHWQDSNAIGSEAMARKKKEDAQVRMMGKKTTTRKGKRSCFFKRPDKSFTEKRKTLSNTKSDMNVDLNHNLPEASDDYEDEAEDVEMQGENADGKDFNDHHNL